MEDVQLADMLESYPPQTTPGFQTLITAKKEFSELASDVTERLPPGRGKFFKHQKFTHRFLRAYDDLVVLSETGTGKSCESIGFLEYTRKELEKAKVDPSKADEKAAHFKRVVILVKGPTQKNEFKNQLACKCSDGHYETGIVKKAKTETVQKTNLTLEIKKAGYIVSTYTSFARRFNNTEKYPPGPVGDAIIAEEYSDTIFWIDEAHNLLIDPDTPNTYKEKQQTYSTIWRVLHLARRSKRIISTATPMINGENEIGSLMNLILPLNGVIPIGYDYRTAPLNDIRVLFPDLPFDYRTATPEQMAPYFRGQIPPDYNFKGATIQDLEPYFRGRLSFVRSSDTGAIPVEVGIRQQGEYEINGVKYQSQLVIYTTAMSQHQSDGYLASRQGVKDEFFTSEREASNFVFPDGYWGQGRTDEERAARREARRVRLATKAAIAAGEQQQQPANLQQEEIPLGGMLPIGIKTDADATETNIEGEVREGFERRAFRRYVAIRGDSYAATPEFAPWLQDLTYIRTLSCKFAEIVRLVSDEPGNAFVYGEFVEGSGAIVLALCFEGLGFTRYNETSSMFLGIGGEAVKPVCAGSDKDVTLRRVRPDILPSVELRPSEEDPNILVRTKVRPFRYALLTGETAANNAKFSSMMEAMNSYENRHGDYIKVLISSRVGRDAINVNNVLQIHLIGPEWNQSAIYQALSRGIRATSHEDLLNEEKERIQLEGGDPNTASITVKIYKHAAVALDEANSSVDLQMYRISEYKDRGIKRMMRIMKQCAIGCQIHYNRNVRADDIDGTPVCDYDVCRYQCVDPPPTSEDYTTYDVLYSNEVIADAVDDIVNIYRGNNALTLDDISRYIPQYRRKYIIMALERLITNKTPLIDRFGYTTYLREDKGSFYLDRSYPTGVAPSYAMSYYTQGIIAIEQESLANIVVGLEAGENKEILAELETMNPTDPQFDARLGAISIEGQASILEDVIIRALRGQRTAFTDAIINKFTRMVFPIREPVTELNKVYEQVAQRKPRRGRKRNPDTKRRIKKINPITIDEIKITNDEDTEVVYLHTMYSQVINQTGYATTARYNKAEGRTRLLKPSEIEDGWRDLNEVELPVYNAFIQIEIAKRQKPFEDQGIYGFILQDGKFRIRDKLTEGPRANDDARLIKRGKVCTTWYKPELISLMFEVGVPEPGGIFPNYTEESKPQLIQALLQKRVGHPYEELVTWPLNKLVYFLKWHSVHNGTRELLCDLIKRHMADTGRLIT